MANRTILISASRVIVQVLLLSILITWLCGTGPAHAAAAEFHPTRLIVKFKQQLPATSLDAKATSLGASGITPIFPTASGKTQASRNLEKTYALDFTDSTLRRLAEDRLQSDPTIAYVERDYAMQLFNDPLYQYQWSLENTGQEYFGIIRVEGPNNDTLKMLSGVPDADIDRHEADDLPTDRDRVRVAIIDTGVDYQHPDIGANIWRNMAEANGLPGRDDDLNGYVDDIVGYDFSGDSTNVLNIIPDPDPTDTIGHGTHVAGIVGAITGNDIGIEGVAPNVDIICVKIFPNAFSSVTSQAIIYAVEQGAKVINASWGSPFFSSVLNDAVEYARDNGVLFVAASGNSGDSSPFYPAVLPGVLTVGASNSSDQATYFSTFGDWVDLSAPGQDILSLRAENTDLYAAAGEAELRIIQEHYLLADGTSMAAPHVTGATAFILSYSPGISSDSMKNLLMSTADQIDDPDGNPQGEYSIYSGYGRINLERATAVLSGTYAEIESPVPNSIKGGVITISGSAFSASGEDFILEARPASEGTYIQIASGPANRITEQLATWDSSPYDGDTELRLKVGDDIAYSTTIRLINNFVVDIENPVDGDTVTGAVEITGTASGPDFSSYNLTYIPQNEPKTPVLIKHGTIPAYSEVLMNWSLGLVRSGPGLLVLRLNAGDQEFEKVVPITVKTLLEENYPIAPATRPHHVSQAADLDGDGYAELVTGGTSGVIVHGYVSGETRLIDPDIGLRYQSAQAVYDFNHDGRDELVVVSDSGISVINGDGEHLPGWPRMVKTGPQFLSYPTPLVSDIDNDGDPEIAFINNAGEFFCFRSDGSGYFHSRSGLFASITSTGLPRLFSQAVPAYVFAYDFNEDGFRDIGSVYGVPGGDGGVFVYSGKNGLPLYPDVGARVIQTGAPFGAVMADFDKDGVPEIGFAHYNDNLEIVVRIVESTGQDLPGWPREYPNKFQYLSSYPAAGDLDGDSLPEFIVGLSAPLDGGELYIWHSDGTPWLESDFGRRDGFVAGVGNSMANPLIIDSDNDNEYEIVIRGGATLLGTYERIYSFELDGTQTPGWPLYTFTNPGSVLYSPNTPLGGDFDNDGLLELYMGGSDSRLYVWKLPTPASDSAIVWNGFLNDRMNSGILPFVPKQASPPDDPVLPTSFRLAQNYPNPFNATTVIEFDLTQDRQTKLEIFNTLGQRVTTLVNEPLSAGFYRYQWDATDSNGDRVASGVYFYRLRFGNSTETRSMVLLK